MLHHLILMYNACLNSFFQINITLLTQDKELMTTIFMCKPYRFNFEPGLRALNDTCKFNNKLIIILKLFLKFLPIHFGYASFVSNFFRPISKFPFQPCYPLSNFNHFLLDFFPNSWNSQKCSWTNFFESYN